MANKTISEKRYNEILDQLEDGTKCISCLENLNEVEKNEIYNDKLAMEIAASSNYHSLKFASIKLRSNMEFMSDCVCMDIKTFPYASTSLLVNDEFITFAVEKTKENTRAMINKSYEHELDEEKYIDACVAYGKKIINDIKSVYEHAQKVENRKKNAEALFK